MHILAWHQQGHQTIGRSMCHTFMNITQMLSSLTCTQRLKWLDNPSPPPSASEPVQQAPTAATVQPSVAPATPKEAVAKSPKAATHTQQKTPATADVQPPTGRTDVTLRQSGSVTKAPQCLIEHI